MQKYILTTESKVHSVPHSGDLRNSDAAMYDVWTTFVPSKEHCREIIAQSSVKRPLWLGFTVHCGAEDTKKTNTILKRLLFAFDLYNANVPLSASLTM